MKKNIFLLLIVIFFLLPMQNIAAQSSNAGFVQGNIWYSKDPFEENDNIRIYTVIFNPDDRELSGVVLFFDQTKLLGRKDFTVAGKSIKDVFIDWTAATGEHVIFARIENAKLLISKGKYQEVFLTENKTEDSSRIVEKKSVVETISLGEQGAGLIADSVKKIENVVQEYTPNFIVKPIVGVATALENLRENISTKTENKKLEIKGTTAILSKADDLKINENGELVPNSKKAESSKPLAKTLELSFFSIISIFFKYKILYYGILTIFAWLLIRYIWHLIFLRVR